MNIRPHPTKPKVWVITFWYQGRHYKKRIPAVSLREATNYAALMRAKVAQNIWKAQPEKPLDPLMSEATQKFIDEYSKLRKKSCGQDIIYGRRCDSFFQGKRLSQITAHDVERFRAWIQQQRNLRGGKPLNDVSANRHQQFAKAVVNKMIRWKLYAGSNAFREVKLSDESKYQKDRVLSAEEYQRLIGFASANLRPIIIVGVHAALRPGEMRAMTRSQVNLDSCSLHLPDSKSGKRQWIPMNETVYKTIEPLVKACKDDVQKVFDFTGFDRRWKNARKAAGLTDCRFYDATRHTGGSWITMTSGGLAATQRILRHKDPKTTMRYSHWAEPQLRQAVLGLDKVLGSPDTTQTAATPLPA